MSATSFEESKGIRLFQAAIQRHHDALMALSPYRLRRYLAGDIPHGIRWMLRFPALLRELAELAEQEARKQESGEGEKLRE